MFAVSRKTYRVYGGLSVDAFRKAGFLGVLLAHVTLYFLSRLLCTMAAQVLPRVSPTFLTSFLN